MRTKIALAVLLSLILGAASVLDACGGWGPGGCPPVGGFVRSAAYAASVYEWRYDANDYGRVHLFHGGRPVSTHYYTTGQTGAYDPAPVYERQKSAAEAKPAEQNFGVDWKPNGHGPRYTLGGQEVAAEVAMQAIAGGQVPDDRNKFRLSVIGPESDRKKVLADLDSHPVLAPFKDRLLVQSYPPDHWQVAGVGAKADGKPTIYVQAPPDEKGKGKVLHRQDDYTDGPEGLATALRKADPSYKAEADRDLRKPDLIPGLPNVPLWWLAAAVVALFLFFRKRPATA